MVGGPLQLKLPTGNHFVVGGPAAVPRPRIPLGTLVAVDASRGAWDQPPSDLNRSEWTFPDPSRADSDGLVAIGGDLEAATLIDAYRSGLFPMPVSKRHIGWFSPDPRGIIPIDALRVTRSLRQSMRRSVVTVNEDFERVMRACADPRRPHGWINETFISAYTRLHRLGWAHSVETRTETGELVGGLYGVRIGGFFAGESMFSLQRDASKVALVALVELMKASRMELLDVQWLTAHLESLGATAIPRSDYLGRLARATIAR